MEKTTMSRHGGAAIVTEPESSSPPSAEPAMNRTSHNDRFCAGRQNKRAIESDGTLTRFVSGSSTFQSANYGSGFGRDLGLLYDKKWIFSAGGYGVHGFALRP